MTTMTGRFIDVSDGKLYAHIRDGEGPTLVFLHYWGGSQRTWAPVIDLLDARHPVVAYDQRGWGDSSSVPGPFSIAQLADDAITVIESLELTSYVLVGHSMGGKVAPLVAARRPAGLVGVVLVAPASPVPLPMPEEMHAAMLHAYDNAENVGQSIDLVLSNGGLTPELRAQVIDDSLRGSHEAYQAWPETALYEDVSAGLGNINVPVTVLAGREDRIDPPEVIAAHLLPLIPAATMTVLTDTGHLSPLEASGQVASGIETFLSTLN